MDRLRGYGVPIVLVGLAVGITINFILLVPALGKLSRQANDGKLARDRQCRVFPVSVKLFKAAYRYHLISRADLRTFLAVAPNCKGR